MLTRWRRTVAAAGLAGVLVAAGATMASADGPGFQEDDGTTTNETTPDSGGGSISVAVKVTTTSTTASGSTHTVSVARRVQPLCWYLRGKTGYEYYEYWKPGGEARESDTLDDFAYQNLLNPDYEKYKDDKEGRWYEPFCGIDTPADFARQYYLSHTGIFVEAGDPPPTAEVEVDVRELAEIAYDAMELPEGTLTWNPKLSGTGAAVVNTGTWVWVEDAAETATVRAEVGDTWAEVSAHVTTLRVSSPDLPVDECSSGEGGPKPTAGHAACIAFPRSTARLGSGSGGGLPTATITATATWAASWTSSEGGGAQDLGTQPGPPASGEVPVAEVQSIVEG
ncbi:hypothetical protein [Cellulomonas massiliensis]|uniref:hypothetical protein n=1 Tax=Cellulomonas massiliensis TaxID=1465811 RepID=UPI00036E31D7|nr:hypothetical protein [Cellulomonas massiliensis]